MPDDKNLYLDAGCALALDIGWVGHLAGRRAGLCDGAPHAVELRFDAPSSTYTLLVDGAMDARATFGAADPAEPPPDWAVVVGGGWGGGSGGDGGGDGGDSDGDGAGAGAAGASAPATAPAAAAFVRNVTYAYSAAVPVSHLHLAGLDVRHVGWGLGRSGNTDFQAASFLAVAAVHLVNARFVTLADVGVRPLARVYSYFSRLLLTCTHHSSSTLVYHPLLFLLLTRCGTWVVWACGSRAAART